MNHYNTIITELSTQHKIKIEKTFDDDEGRANIKDRIIYIPKRIKSFYSFMIALHEIGHIVTGKQKYIFYGEYLAERYAIDIAQQYNINPKSYFDNAKYYISCKLQHAWNNGLKLKHIPLEVELFALLDIESYIEQYGQNFKFKFNLS